MNPDSSDEAALNVDAVLARVAQLLDRHQLGAAERLLGPLLADPIRLASATPQQQCRALIDWGWLLGATQRLDAAASAFASAIQLAEMVQLSALLTEALRESAVVARYKGDFRGADALLTRAEHIAYGDGQLGDLSRILFLRATVAHHIGAFLQAHTLLDQAFTFAESCPPGDATTLLLADIGRERAVSARLARDFDAARDLLTDARDRYASIGRRVGIANTERELGAVAQSLGDFDTARRHHARAVVAYLRAGRRLGAAAAARRLGHLDLHAATEGDPSAAALHARARRRFAQSLRLGGGEPTNAVKVEMFLGTLARLEHDLDEAQRRFVSAGQQYAAMATVDRDVARELSEVAFELGRVARERGDRSTAITMFEQALAALQPGDDPGAESLNHYQLALELIQDGRIDEATRHALAAFTRNEDSGRVLRDPTDRQIYYQLNEKTYDLALHCAASVGDAMMALRIATASRSEALAAFVRTGARLSTSLRELVNEIALADAEADQDRLTQLYQRLERETSVQLRQSMSPGEPDLDGMITSLPEGGHALLVDSVGDWDPSEEVACIRIWISPEGGYVDEVLLVPRVRRILDSYRVAAVDSIDTDTPGVRVPATLDELAILAETLLPEGLVAALAAGADPPVVIATGGMLSTVPVAALRVRGRYLAELARLVLVPSLALWQAVRRRPARDGTGTLAFLDPDLPGSVREEHALRRYLPPVRAIGATEVRSELADASGYAMVVLGAHGGARPGLAQSLHLTAGDELTAADLLTCHLPDGVVMASCGTGRLAVRPAVEPLGLPTAALLAGARWVLAGMVDLASTPTATIMTACYANIASGLSPVDALHRAQRDYLRRRTDVAPEAWAGLAIVGDGFTPS